MISKWGILHQSGRATASTSCAVDRPVLSAPQARCSTPDSKRPTRWTCPAVGSPGFQRDVDAIKGRILCGARLTEALDDVQLLPAVALSMVNVGEAAGRLPATFEPLGDTHDRAVRAAVNCALGLLEPVVTLALVSWSVPWRCSW